ncbi:hypothetical protein H6F67_19965 [Microcoleus sp. FACHB-1515]|uniref:hypothetical protein n=1 Tax=Cyanophyceae TaxID=3028117 RepID=UPI001689A879|nr:hypothetical protein [Microcoleus sp. FACHB-1515]MBD2092129.1 hypothetical protein [Microcoleus sp. FACHB-1515]
MAINNKLNLNSRTIFSKSKIALLIVVRNAAIGLISGCIMGAFFGVGYFTYSIFTLWLGAGLGLVLGLVNGLLLSIITCQFFHPLRSVFFYRILVELISASTAGGGTAVFGLWLFSSRRMTPTTAVFIGFNSVLASLVAGCAGALAGQNISRWYTGIVQRHHRSQQEQTAKNTLPNSTSLNEIDRDRRGVVLSEIFGWIGVALFSLICSFFGYNSLKQLICGSQDVILCFSSPRLYTSFIAGYKAILFIIFRVLLIPAGVLFIFAIVRSQTRR